jgi:WD40 repeat protein
VREGVPAVVAMQYEITDTAALVFASSFYGQIAQGVPVDRAMTRAREAVKMTNDSLEWATPVLFLSSEETQIFEVPEPARGMRRPEPTPKLSPHRESDLRRLRVLRPAGPCGHMAAGPGDFLAVAGSDGVARVVSASTGQILSECALPQRTRLIQLAWSPWPRYLASLHEDGTIVVWNAETRVPARIIQAPERQLDLLQQSDLLRSAVRHIDSLRSMTPRIGGIAFSGNGKWLAAVGSGQVHFFDTQGNHARELRLEPDRFAGSQWLVTKPRASAVLFTAGDRHVLVAAGDGTVRLFDVHGQVLMTLRHPKPVLGIAATHDRLATGSTDGQIRTWSWDGHLIWQTGHGSPAEHLAFSPDGSALAAAAEDSRLSLWDRGGAFLGKAALSGRPVGIHCADDTVLTADQGGALELWSFEWQQSGEGHRD